jgi:hypothetical protein
MSRTVFYTKRFSSWLGESRAYYDIDVQGVPEPSPTPVASSTPTPTSTMTPTPTPSFTPSFVLQLYFSGKTAGNSGATGTYNFFGVGTVSAPDANLRQYLDCTGTTGFFYNISNSTEVIYRQRSPSNVWGVYELINRTGSTFSCNVDLGEGGSSIQTGIPYVSSYSGITIPAPIDYGDYVISYNYVEPRAQYVVGGYRIPGPSGTGLLGYSINGTSFSSATNLDEILPGNINTGQTFESVTFGNDLWVAVSKSQNSGSKVYISYDGKAWSGNSFTSSLLDRNESVIWDGTRFLIGGWGTSPNYYDLIESTDALSWSNVTTQVFTGGTGIKDLVYNSGDTNGYYYAAISDLVSPYLSIANTYNSWSGTSFSGLGYNPQLTEILWTNIPYLAGSRTPTDDTEIFYSNDAINWSASTNVPSLLPNAGANTIVYGNSIYIAMADITRIKSTDGITWSTFNTLSASSYSYLGSVYDGTHIYFGALALSGFPQYGIVRTIDANTWEDIPVDPKLFGTLGFIDVIAYNPF